MTQLKQPRLWQKPEWPYFQWDSSALLDSLVKVRHQQGRLLSVNSFSKEPLQTTTIQADIEKNYMRPLTKERLCGWHASIFPTGFSGVQKIQTGDYRKKDFVLNSDQAVPAAASLNDEMKKFLAWWNDSPVGLDGIIRAGLAHFWFATIQPFEDGNGRISRALIKMALAQDEKSGFCSYEIESAFKKNESFYFSVLEKCQTLNGDITPWLNWLFEELLKSMQAAEKKSLSRFAAFNLNSRQKVILKNLICTEGDQKTITNRWCVQLCQASRESIKRDLSLLVSLGILVRGAGQGRSVVYSLNTSSTV